MLGSFSSIQRKVKFLFFPTCLYWIFHASEEEGEKADSGVALVCWSKNLLWCNFALGHKRNVAVFQRPRYGEKEQTWKRKRNVQDRLRLEAELEKRRISKSDER